MQLAFDTSKISNNRIKTIQTIKEQMKTKSVSNKFSAAEANFLALNRLCWFFMNEFCQNASFFIFATWRKVSTIKTNMVLNVNDVNIFKSTTLYLWAELVLFYSLAETWVCLFVMWYDILCTFLLQNFISTRLNCM